jgi:hypothetical protein
MGSPNKVCARSEGKYCEGFAVACCAVERLVADLGFRGVIRGKPVRTTVQDKAAQPPSDG